MSITLLPNQPLAAVNEAPFKCNTRYYLPVQRNDAITLQGFSTMQTGATTIVNMADFTLGAGFSYTAGQLSYAGNSSITTATSPTLNLVVGNLYQLFVQVIVAGTGGAGTNQGFAMTFNGNHLTLPNGGTAGYNDSFILSQFYCPTAVNDDQIVISTNYPQYKFTVSVAIIPCSIPHIAAYDVNNNFVAAIAPQYIKYFTAPDFDFSSPFNVIGLPCRFDIQFKLDTLPDGCYSVNINEGSGIINNGNFADGTGWVPGTNWTIASNKACYATAQADSNQELVTNINVEQGVTSTFSFSVTGLQGLFNNGVQLQVSLQFNNSNTPLTQIYRYDGLNTFAFTAPAGSTGVAILRFIIIPTLAFHNGQPVVPAANVCINNIQTPASGWQSNNIAFRTAFGDVQTHYFTGYNNDGAFDFDYSQGLIHGLRLWSKIKYKDYKQQVTEYNFSDNSNALLTSYVEKVYEITIGDCAEFVHDCLSMLMLTDNFAVDSVPYIREGSYGLKQRKSTELSIATFDVKPIKGIGKNWNVN